MAELAVIQQLPVVRVGARGQQQLGERERVRVLVLVVATQRAGRRCIRRVQAVPQVAGVRIAAVLQQRAGRAERGFRADPRIVPGAREVQQRLPSVRAALAAGQRWIGRDLRPDRCLVPGGGRDVDAGAGQVGVGGQHPGRSVPAGGLVVAAEAQAGERKEFIRRSGGLVDLVGEPAVPLDHLQVLLQPRPGGEPVVPGDYELRAGQRDRVGALGVILGDQLQGSGHARAGQVPHVLGLFAELIQAGVVG